MNPISKSIAFFCVLATASAFNCIDQDNNPVDWFIVYKIPQIDHTDELINDGLGYIYMTSQNTSWIPSDVSINSNESMLALTLSGLNSSNYVLYNNEPPQEKASMLKGHTKGVVSFDSEEGFWLVHTVPEYPTLNSSEIPKNATKLGQMFVCLSLELATFDDIGYQLYYIQPRVYAHYVDPKLQKKVPQLVKAARNMVINRGTFVSKKLISTKNNETFISFGKFRRAGKELYSDVLATMLKSNLLVESWPGSGKRLESQCNKKLFVENIENIRMNESGSQFMTSMDLSNWAITNSNSSIVCLGDLQQTRAHIHRSGGAICLKNKDVYENFQNLILDSTVCEKVQPVQHKIKPPKPSNKQQNIN
ncbi:unnamed protein product [Phyllotreta striolata]|uniref:Plancitoxin-1 n=1 Tax=Phyllotreta striolata TaxID=444603 RepID=A0A9N9TG77_PHYSR|nr:unnamed protein product [Phyllotreta striolata]